ncbi:hypothetical protein [Pandoravirus japonicus]|uniref:Uncharacterized protein n=1 Tax=Pandoravirus japonicus TaxID=2823154 RepID=A0A811BSS0_9VIRU|nr:hypothetical protein [Pandoravirus japonicus]
MRMGSTGGQRALSALPRGRCIDCTRRHEPPRATPTKRERDQSCVGVATRGSRPLCLVVSFCPLFVRRRRYARARATIPHRRGRNGGKGACRKKK